MQNFVKRGETIAITAPYALKSGGGVKLGNIFGVAVFDALISTMVEVMVQGVFDLTKDTSTFATGDSVFWDDSAKKATSVSGGHMRIGVANITTEGGTNALGGGSGDATVRVRLAGSLLNSLTTGGYGTVCVTTNGTTAVDVFSASGAPTALTVTGVFIVSRDTTTGNITLSQATNTVVTLAKGATAGVAVGGGTLTHTVYAASDVCQVLSSSAGNADVFITFSA